MNAPPSPFHGRPGAPHVIIQGLDAIEASAAAQAAAEQATATNNATIGAYADDLKSNLRYTENTVNFDDLKFKTIGWGGRRERPPLTAPGRALDLKIVEEGEGRIRLRWTKPMDGGKPAAYNVLSRERAVEGEAWILAPPREAWRRTNGESR